MMKTLVMIGAMLAGGPAPATVPLQSSGKWTVEYNESMCVLRREFGTGDNTTVFALRPSPLGEMDELVLLTRDAGGKRICSDKGSVTLQPNDETVEGNFQSYRLPETSRRITTIWLEHDDLAGLADSRGIAFQPGRDTPVSLATGDLKRALAALATCQDGLLKDWGIDPAIAKTVAVRAKGNPGKFFGDDAYPSKAVRAGETGAVVVAYMVGLDGRARDCRVVVTSKSEALDETTCRIIEERVRYTPALDKSGKPIATPATVRVNWEMPE